MDYFELECAVEEWAQEKGILDKATPMAQALKTLEETTELCTAINSNEPNAKLISTGNLMRLTTIKFIKKGDELFTKYQLYGII